MSLQEPTSRNFKDRRLFLHPCSASSGGCFSVATTVRAGSSESPGDWGESQPEAGRWPQAESRKGRPVLSSRMPSFEELWSVARKTLRLPPWKGKWPRLQPKPASQEGRLVLPHFFSCGSMSFPHLFTWQFPNTEENEKDRTTVLNPPSRFHKLPYSLTLCIWNIW